MRHRYLSLLLPALLLAACDRAPEPPPVSVAEPAPAGEAATDLLDSSLPHAVAGDEGWVYARAVSADLDGDGEVERAVLIANVPLHEGRPLWEDGHHWQLYIEEPGGARTHVYSRFVPHGQVEALLGGTGEGGAPGIVLIERTPHRLGIYEVRYGGPARASTLVLTERELDPGRGFTGTPNQ